MKHPDDPQYQEEEPTATPGPWVVVGETEIMAYPDTPDCIVIGETHLMHGPVTDEMRRNARLMAAAPDLLAAAEALLAWCQEPNVPGGKGGFDVLAEDIVPMFDAAVAAAKGEQAP